MHSARGSSSTGRSRAALSLATALLIATSVPLPSTADGTFLVQILALSERVELALYYAKTALLAPNSRETDVYVDEIRRLVLAAEGGQDQSVSIADSAERLLASSDDVATDPRTQAEIEASLESVRAYAERIVEDVAALPRTSAVARTDALRRIHAYLLAARGGIPFALPGLADVLASLPNAERTASPGDSLQDHIDRLLPGGTLHLAAGTYALTEGLVIDKSMTLRAAPDAGGAVRLAMGIGSTSAVISVAARTPDPLWVRILGVTVRGGAVGVAIGESGGVVSQTPVTVTIDTASIVDSGGIGVRVASGSADLIACDVAGHREHGLVIPWTGEARLSNCTVTGNGTAELLALGYRTSGGVDVAGEGKVELRGCRVASNLGTGLRVADRATAALDSTEIADNAQDGIQAGGASAIHLRGCVIHRNRGFGLRLLSPACVVEGEPTLGVPFTGDVTGNSNAIPDSTAVDGNEGGDVCPSTFALPVAGD